MHPQRPRTRPRVVSQATTDGGQNASHQVRRSRAGAESLHRRHWRAALEIRSRHRPTGATHPHRSIVALALAPFWGSLCFVCFVGWPHPGIAIAEFLATRALPPSSWGISMGSSNSRARGSEQQGTEATAQAAPGAAPRAPAAAGYPGQRAYPVGLREQFLPPPCP